MAWQLHYTSARKGPTGRAGFQFVAETPGLPEGARAEVTPYLSYRPPPDAPLSPETHELDRFPVALLYDRVAGRPLLLRCRYLGRDYSGRYGNFFAHAVVAEDEELEGLRPAELWHAPLWNDAPLDEGVLPELEELSPGAESDPEYLAEWLAGHEAHGDAYGLLARLMDAVSDVLADGHGRVVLVSDDVEAIARWIAVVSYSLPVASAATMTFVTYSADPDSAAQRLVGTTPDVWASSQRQAGHAFHLDGSPAVGGARPSRYARTVADCWRAFDFDGLDALSELAPSGMLDEAAALLALCRGDGTVTAGEEAAVARLIERHGDGIPGWVWRDLTRDVPVMGLDLALAVHARALEAGAGNASQVRAAAARGVREGNADLASALARTPDELREPLLDGVLSVLAEAGQDVRRAILTGPACEALYADRDRLMAVPDVATRVLVTVAARRPEHRVAVTGDLLRLDAAKAIEQVWKDPPSATECLELLDAHPEEFAPPGVLSALPSRVFDRVAHQGDAALRAPETQQLVARICAVRPDPGGDSARAAAAIGAYTDAVTAQRPEGAAEAIAALTASEPPEPLAENVLTTAAHRLAAHRDARFLASLLAAAPAAVRSRLGALWAAMPRGTRSKRNELIEVVLRLRRLGVHEPGLDAWAREAARRWLSARLLDAHFAGDPELRAALKDLIAEARGRGE